MTATIEDVSTIATALPEVVEGDRRGQRTWAVNGKVFAWERAFSKADLRRYGDQAPPAGPIVAVRVADLGEKEAVLSAHRGPVFTIPHFDGFPAVLLHLETVPKKVLRELVVDAWLACAPSELAQQYRSR